eukprot:290137-Amphidinium_carterae.2
MSVKSHSSPSSPAGCGCIAGGKVSSSKVVKVGGVTLLLYCVLVPRQHPSRLFALPFGFPCSSSPQAK